MKKQFFPWRLFWKFFISLVLLMNGLIFLILICSAFIFNLKIFTSQNIFFVSAFFGGSLIGSLIFAYRFALPMRRVILKALRMANKQLFMQLSEKEMDEQSLFESEPGEYFELELALDQIRKKMKKRREQLAHEREESQTLMSSIEDGVVNINPDGRILYFNSGFAAHFLQMEVNPSEQVLTLSHVMRDADVLNMFDQALKQGVGGNLHREMATLLNIGVRHFSIAISPLKDPKTKEIYAALGIFHDITETKRAEKIRMEFVENASHELRTPLTSIKGYLETFKEDYAAGKTEQASMFLGMISKNVDRLIELVNDLLTISSLERGSNLEIESIDTEQITSSVVDRFAGIIQEKKIVLDLNFKTKDDFKGDPRKIEQVLENLISNAIKYGNMGGKIAITWDENQMTHHILLHVKDYGSGISMEHLPRLFERFYRVDKGRSRDVGGTGLGLAIVKHIMQSHGGTVSVTSELGQGAEFICSFPSSESHSQLR